MSEDPNRIVSRPFGLILMGGQSKRMGRDKATLDYHGEPQYQWLQRLLSPYCEKVYYSCSVDNQHLVPNASIVDKKPFEGPLVAISEAFRFNPEVDWLICACDMPGLTSELIAEISLAKTARPVIYYRTAHGVEPLFSLWKKEIVEALFEEILRGERSPRRFLEKHEIPAWRFLENASLLKNINSPE